MNFCLIFPLPRWEIIVILTVRAQSCHHAFHILCWSMFWVNLISWLRKEDGTYFCTCFTAVSPREAWTKKEKVRRIFLCSKLCWGAGERCLVISKLGRESAQCVEPFLLCGIRECWVDTCPPMGQSSGTDRVSERRVSRRHVTGACRLQRIRNDKKNMTDPQSWHSERSLKIIFCGANETIAVTTVLLTWTQVFKRACFNSLSFNKHHLLWEVNLENSQVWMWRRSHLFPWKFLSVPICSYFGQCLGL